MMVMIMIMLEGTALCVHYVHTFVLLHQRERSFLQIPNATNKRSMSMNWGRGMKHLGEQEQKRRLYIVFLYGICYYAVFHAWFVAWWCVFCRAKSESFIQKFV